MNRMKFTPILLLTIFLLTACSGVQLFPPAATPTPFATLSPTATQPTPTPRPTFTFTPSPTRDLSMVYQMISTENVDDLTERYLLTESDYAVMTSLAFSPDGNLLATAGNGEFIRLWSVHRGELLASLPGHTGDTRFLTFSPDGRLLVSANSDKTIRLWDTSTFQIASILGQHTDTVTVLTFSADGRWLVSGGLDGQVIVWDLEGQTIAAYLQQEGPVGSVAFSPDSSTLATTLSDGTFDINLWGAPDFENIKTIKMTARVSQLAFSPDGSLLATAIQDEANPTVYLLNPETGKTVRTLKNGHSLALTSVAFNPDGTLLVSTSADASLTLWETATGKLLRTFSLKNSANFAAFSPDGSLLAAVDSGSQVILWSLPLVPAPTATPTITPDLSTPTFVPMSTPGCDGGASQLAIGFSAGIADGLPPLRVRSSPSTAGDVIASLNAGISGKVVDGPICADGLIFWRIEETSLIPGGSGWVAETNGTTYWLEPNP